jgi:glycosyltransferase involved in cell wall biosynthesis
MKIAQVAPLYEAVPPATYGGTERVVAALCDGLSALGHDVTLFAPATSTTDATLVETVPVPLRVGMSRQELVQVAPHLHLSMLADVYERASEFDIIHSHADLWTLPFAALSDVPTILTMHGRLDLDEVRQTLPHYPSVGLVSISRHQRRAVEDLPVRWVGNVYNGLDLTAYHRPDVVRGRHLAFVGRISPEKGPETAVEVARRTDRTLWVGAKVDPTDLAYYEDVIEPLFSQSDVRFVGELDEHQKTEFYASAAATVFPSDWPEPFGLVMIESLAAGTPVIALDRGSVPEILLDGVTGFICRDTDDMVDAVLRLDQIDPDACRQRARTFDSHTMCASYERLYMNATQLAPPPVPDRHRELAPINTTQ